MKLKISVHNAGPVLQTNETPEQWWAAITAEQRSVAHQIALMMRQVSDDKRIEIRKDLEKIRARFIHILKRPEEGCVNAIMLPEPTRCSWN